MGRSSVVTWVANNLEAAVGIAGLVVTIVGAGLAWWLKRKRVTYRVHLDTPVGLSPKRNGDDGDDIDVQLLYKEQVITDPSFALVRIMNTGSREIRDDDLRDPLTLEFGGRKVVDAKIVEASTALRRIIARQKSWPPVGDTELVLPRVPLNRKHRIKVLVLLTGKPDDKPTVTCDGYVSGGKIRRDTTRGDGPSRRGMVLSAVAMLAVGASLALLIVTPWGARDGVCAPGAVTITGSSAFAPVAKDIVKSYTDQCDAAEVSVAGRGSLDGLRELDALGRDDPAQREARVTMSDGPASANYHNLTPHPVGVVAFAVVVNKATGRHQLTADQIRAIYAGQVSNWNQLGGPDLPVSIVSRGAGSGTRQAFEEKVIGRVEPAVSSNDCLRADRDPTASVVRCEYDSTSALLDQVDRLPGAIGYAELTATTRYTNINRVKLDDRDPDLDSVVKRGYPFWAVEYFYTYGPPQDGKLLDALLSYLNSDTAKNILRRSGYVPCVDGQDDLMATLCR